MRSLLIAFASVALAANIVGATGDAAQDAERQLKAAMNTELVDGNLKLAIEQYKKVADSGNRALAAQALLRMAACYQKLGDGEAQKTYERLIREFSDQKEAVSVARAQLGKGAAATGPVARQLWTGLTAVETEVSIGADGRTVAIVDRSDYPIGVRDLSTGRVTKLIASDDPQSGVEWPTLSPDMRQIAYTWYGARAEVRLASVERDAKPRTVVARPEFRYYFVRGWARDGKSILATIVNDNQTTQIAWISVADGAVTTLKAMDRRDPGLLSLSPDGRYIAYDALAENDASDREIRIMATDGSTDSVVAPSPAINESPVWTRDGGHIFFKSNRTGVFGLWSISIRAGKADGPPKLEKADVGNITPVGFTSTGSLLYTLLLGHRDVFTIDVDPSTGKTRGEPARAVDTFLGSNMNPTWSPDGATIAYISRRTDPASQTGTLVVKSLESGRDRVIGRPFQGPYAPMWLSDSSAILQAAKDSRNKISVYTIDPRSGDTRETFNTGAGGPASPTVSMNSKTLYAAVFREEDIGGHVVAGFDLATKRRVTIDTGSSQVKSVAASPDGHSVAFVTHEYATDRVGGKNAPQSRLYLAKSDGSDPRAVFTSERAEGTLWDIAWTPDSRFIYFHRRDGNRLQRSQLWRISASGGAPEYAGLSSDDVIGPLDVSRDGKRLLYGVGHAPSSEVWALENFLPARAAAKPSAKK